MMAANLPARSECQSSTGRLQAAWSSWSQRLCLPWKRPMRCIRL